jgi:hypothetical protein
MGDFSEIWGIVQRISGVAMVTFGCLYVVRCVATFSVLNLHQFGHFVLGLVAYIVS